MLYQIVNAYRKRKVLYIIQFFGLKVIKTHYIQKILIKKYGIKLSLRVVRKIIKELYAENKIKRKSQRLYYYNGPKQKDNKFRRTKKKNNGVIFERVLE